MRKIIVKKIKKYKSEIAATIKRPWLLKFIKKFMLYMFYFIKYKNGKIAICDYRYNCKNSLKLDIFHASIMMRQLTILNNPIACKLVNMYKKINTLNGLKEEIK